MKKHNKAMLAKVIAVLLAITALAPAVYAADKALEGDRCAGCRRGSIQ